MSLHFGDIELWAEQRGLVAERTPFADYVRLRDSKNGAIIKNNDGLPRFNLEQARTYLLALPRE